jgi:hypothetical protein
MEFQPTIINDTHTIDAQLKRTQKKLMIVISVLIVVNTTLFTLFIPGRDYGEKLKASIGANLVGYNLVGLLLGTLVALLPYKGLNYSRKYLRASLLSIFVLQAIMFIGLLAIAGMNLAGWYNH